MKDNSTQSFNTKLFFCLLALLFVAYMKMPKKDTVVNCKLMHYITQSSSAISFSTVHVFFICVSVLKFQRNTHASQIWRNFFWSFHSEKLIQPFQQLRKPCFFYVGSTCIDIIKVVNHCFSFWSELEHCPLRPCRLLTAELGGGSLEHLSYFFIFLVLSLQCLKKSFSILPLQVYLVCPWPAKDEAGTL